MNMYAFPGGVAVLTVLVVVLAIIYQVANRRQTFDQYDENEDESERTDTEGAGAQTGADRQQGDIKGILISNRRDESAGYAGRIADNFIMHFGEHRVFHDLDSIEPGLDFVEQIQRAADFSEVLIVVIGRNWLTATDAAGQKRLENPNDHVRIEIATALKRNIRVNQYSYKMRLCLAPTSCLTIWLP
jgi:hypothetical protein